MKVKTLLKILKNCNPELDVEVEFPEYDTVLSIEEAREVREYNLENASRTSPTLLLRAYE